MKFLPRFAGLLLFASAVAPRAAFAQSQHEMNAGAAAEFSKADKELNEVYAKVLGLLDDGSKEKLKNRSGPGSPTATPKPTSAPMPKRAAAACGR